MKLSRILYKNTLKICKSILLNSIAELLNYVYQTSSIRTETNKVFLKAPILKKFIALLHNGRSNNSFFIVPEMDKLLLFLLILKMSILAHILALRDQLFTTADYRASTCGCMGIISAHFILKTIFCVFLPFDQPKFTVMSLFQKER